MKNRKINFIKLGIFLFGISLFFSNCENEVLVEEENSNEKQSIIRRKIAFNNTVHFNKTSPIIKNIKLPKKSNYLSRNIEDENVIVHTDEVQYATYVDTHTYTFKITREFPEYYIENIVLHYNVENDSYDEYLLQYDISAEEFQNIYNGGTRENSKTIITPLNTGTFSNLSSRGTVECDTSCETVDVNCSAGGNHSPGESCSGTPDQQPYQYEFCRTTCRYVEYIDAGDSAGGGGSNTGGGGATDNNPTNNDIITDPLPSNPCENNITGNAGVLNSAGDCINIANTKPCEKITELLNNSYIKDKIQSINNDATFNLDYEKGFNLNDYGNGPIATVNNGNAQETSITVLIDKTNGSSIGFIHTHFNSNKRTSPLFSIEDLRALNAVYQWRKYKQKPLENITVILVSPAGVYAMVIKNYVFFAEEGNNLHTEEFRERRKKYYEEFPKDLNLMPHSDKIEKVVLKQLKKYGVGLFKANDDLSGWNELTLDEQTNNTIPTPCT